jgi:hypothetical protein
MKDQINEEAKKIKECEQNAEEGHEITSSDIKNAHASGDGSMKRSEEAIASSDEGGKDVKTSTGNY